MQVMDRYANAGPFVIDALDRTEQMLIAADRSDRVLVLYERLFSKIKPPQTMAPGFAQQSNYYKVGQRYAAKLEIAGEPQAAQQVRQRIDQQLKDDQQG